MNTSNVNGKNLKNLCASYGHLFHGGKCVDCGAKFVKKGSK